MADSHFSHFLAYLLRHGAREYGLKIDHYGWIDVMDVLQLNACQFKTLNDVAVTCEHYSEGRLQMSEDKLRI
eukprot:11998472-Heterocapsa_arctica.AAC.1